MLMEAHELVKANRDVVAAYVEPHARPETIAMAEGLETIEPLQIEYKGIRLREMDLDAVLKRKPGIALVDELAHTNAEGSRHEKRYEDIEELLDAGSKRIYNGQYPAFGELKRSCIKLSPGYA